VPSPVVRFAEMGGDAKFSTPDGLRGVLAREASTWTTVIRQGEHRAPIQ
jgi:hypothetical protein